MKKKVLRILVISVLIMAVIAYFKVSAEYTATIVETEEIDPLKVQVEELEQKKDSIIMMLDTINSLKNELEEHIRTNNELRKTE